MYVDSFVHLVYELERISTLFSIKKIKRANQRCYYIFEYYRKALALTEMGYLLIPNHMRDKTNNRIMNLYPPAISFAVIGNAQNWIKLRNVMIDLGASFEVNSLLTILIYINPTLQQNPLYVNSQKASTRGPEIGMFLSILLEVNRTLNVLRYPNTLNVFS